MLALRLDALMEARLADLAARTGRTKSFYARAAIAAYLDDLEDFYLAEQRMVDFRPGEGVALEDLKGEFGLAD